MQAGLCYLHDGGSSRHSDSLALGRDACTGARSRQNGGTHTDTRQRESERERERERERDTERAKAKEYQTQQEREKSAISKWSVCQRTHTPERSEVSAQLFAVKKHWL